MVNGNGKILLADRHGRIVDSPTKEYRGGYGLLYTSGVGMGAILGGGPMDQLPWFQRIHIEAMRRWDISAFATLMDKAPFSNVGQLIDPKDRDAGFKGFYVDSTNAEVKRCVEDTLSTICLTGMQSMLLSRDYGQIGVEVLYRPDARRAEVRGIKDFDPGDQVPLREKCSGEIEGFRLRRVKNKAYVDLTNGRSIWIIHRRIPGTNAGVPTHLGAFPPWIEKWHHKGAIACRKLWMTTLAFRGRVIRYPLMKLGPERGFDTPIEAGDYARQILNLMSSGGAFAFPNELDPVTKMPLWEFEEGKMNGQANDILNYPKDLDTEVMRGYGHPDNLVQATLQDATGTMGGRMITFEMWLDEKESSWSQEMLPAIDRMCVSHLVLWNFGPHADYEIRATELIKRQEQGQKNGQQGMPGAMQQGDGFQQQPYQNNFGRMSLDSEIERAVGRAVVNSSAVIEGQRIARRMSQCKYASTHFVLPKDIADTLLAIAGDIPQESLADKGVEHDSHITIKYGIHSDDPMVLQRILADFGPVTVTLGSVGVFSLEDHDVLKVDVHGDEILRLNEFICSSVGNTETHPVFKPHVTIAYVKSSKGDKLVGDNRLDGTRITFDQLAFSSSTGTETAVFLGNYSPVKMAVAHAPKGGVTLDGTFFPGGEFIPGHTQDEVNAAAKKQTHPSAQSWRGTKIRGVKERAFSGEPVPLKTQLAKHESGSIGERVVLSWLHSQGFKDAKPLNEERNNFAADMIHDHRIIEIKTGLVSNRKDAQKWRLTIGEPGAKEKAWLAKASPKAKAKWNARKQAMITERKQALLAQLQKQTGKKVKPGTITVLLDPDRKVADIFVFEGWHDSIRWRSEQSQAAYRGTVQYE